MAMSKRVFVALLAGFIVVLAGAVAVVIVVMKKNNNPDVMTDTGDYDVMIPEYSDTVESTGLVGTKRECADWLKNAGQSWNFAGRFGRSQIAIRETISARSGNKIIRNAYWLTGEAEQDAAAIEGIRIQACMGEIPVVVIKMRPVTGLQVNSQLTSWDYYKPTSSVDTWEDYDVKINKFIRALVNIPVIVILEPDLLMFTFDSRNEQYRWMNSKYEEEFLKRAQRVISRLRKSWVYADAGNAAYLGQSLENVGQMSKTLLRLPGLRGFVINSMHFVNQTYNEYIARRIYCRTGLHYIVDTSRNGGPFSMQPLHKMEQCLFDPPNVIKGRPPGWSWGSQTNVLAPRFKRWIHQIGSQSTDISSGSSSPSSDNNGQQQSPPSVPPRNTNQNNQQHDPNFAVNNYNNQINNNVNDENNIRNVNNNNQPNSRNPTPQRTNSIAPTTTQNTASGEEENLVRSESVATEYLRSFKADLGSCMSKKSFTSSHDANVWLKVPGESDGRMYSHGTYHSCLINHAVGCDDDCQMLVQTNSNQRSSTCQCENRPREQPTQNTQHELFPFS